MSSNLAKFCNGDRSLRPIKRMVDAALVSMSRTFRAAYSEVGRPGIPPEVDEFFGWAKTLAGMRRAGHVGREKIRQWPPRPTT
jgi:hypothetical protein